MTRTACLLPLLLGACRAEPASVHGTVAADSEISRVWAVGAAEPAAVTDGEFRLDALPAGSADLRFGDDEEEIGRLLIAELTPGRPLVLHGVWVDDEGRAFPSTVESRGAPVVIHGIRWASPGELSGEIEERVAVLASARDGRALLARPLREGVPDLRVVLTAATVVRTPDGDPIERPRLRYGDTVAVRGVGEDGFVLAREIVAARAAARRRR